MSWLMAAWTLITMWMMSERWYRVAWRSSILSQCGWCYLAVKTELYGMAALSVVMIWVGYRALRKLDVT